MWMKPVNAGVGGKTTVHANSIHVYVASLLFSLKSARSRVSVVVHVWKERKTATLL